MTVALLGMAVIVIVMVAYLIGYEHGQTEERVNWICKKQAAYRKTTGE
jgi:hypothetical protein